MRATSMSAQGGGQPHLHGDPFHSTDGTCLYGPANYTSDSAHPPLWGFSLDGYNIYGRHLSANNEGYSMALDDCGGHTHGAYGYHYHSQVITAYASTGAQRGVTTGAAYAVFPPGVFKCWRVHAAAPSAEHTQSLKRASTHTRARACPDTSQYFHAFIALANAHLCVRTDTHTHHTSTQKLQMPSLAHPRAHHTLPRSQDHKQAQNRHRFCFIPDCSSGRHYIGSWRKGGLLELG